MNAAIINSAFHAIERAIHPVTVADVCRLYDGGLHTKLALEFAFDIPPETEIHRALRRLDDLANRQRSMREALHWVFDANKLIALIVHRNQLAKALEQKEAA